jgi:hypothetical protein
MSVKSAKKFQTAAGFSPPEKNFCLIHGSYCHQLGVISRLTTNSAKTVNLSQDATETFRRLFRPTNLGRRILLMNKTKRMIASGLILGGLLTVTAPAMADWGYHRELRHDRRELNDARREFRRDFRRGADPDEIARDRAAIARERRELWEDRYSWRRGYDYDRDWGWWRYWRR